MNKVEAIIRPERIGLVTEALADSGFMGLNVVHVTGRGVQKGVQHVGRGGMNITVDMLPKTKLEIVVKEADTQKVIDIILENARTRGDRRRQDLRLRGVERHPCPHGRDRGVSPLARQRPNAKKEEGPGAIPGPSSFVPAYRPQGPLGPRSLEPLPRLRCFGLDYR